MIEDQPEQTDRQKEADKLLASAHRMRWVSLAIGSVLVAAGLTILGIISWQEHQQIKTVSALIVQQHQQIKEESAQIRKQSAQLEASCSFYRDIGAAPLPVKPTAGHQPSDLGVRIVVHSRVAFTGQDCLGDLTPPGPGLLKWAAYYHLKAPR